MDCISKAKPKECTSDYSCKRLIDLYYVLNFKAMSLTQVSGRVKKDFCIVFAGKCKCAVTELLKGIQVQIQVYYKVWNTETMIYHCWQLAAAI